jgi:hypothetical protein
MFCFAAPSGQIRNVFCVLLEAHRHVRRVAAFTSAICITSGEVVTCSVMHVYVHPPITLPEALLPGLVVAGALLRLSLTRCCFLSAHLPWPPPNAGLTLPEALSAGLFVSGTMLLLGLSGLMDAFNAAVPGSIVRGIQLAVGLALAKKVRSATPSALSAICLHLASAAPHAARMGCLPASEAALQPLHGHRTVNNELHCLCVSLLTSFSLCT